MNILFVHEVDWLAKVVFDIHSLAEGLSLLGHRVYAIDYENTWSRNGFPGLGSLKTREFDGISRAFNGASVCLRRPGFIEIPGLSRVSAAFTHYLEIRKTIREKSIDAIVLYSVPTNGLQTIRLARKFNIQPDRIHVFQQPCQILCRQLGNQKFFWLDLPAKERSFISAFVGC